MSGYINGKVEIFYGDSPPLNLNILWQKKIVTSGVESSELMQYNPNLNVWQSLANSAKAPINNPAFTGTATLNGEPIGQAKQPKQLEDILKVCLIKNLEKDNTLATEDWVGQPRATQTPLTFVSTVTTNTYIIANVPYIENLILNPSNWIFWDITYNGSPDQAKKCVSVSYIGNFGEYTNCYQIETVSAITGVAEGHKMAMLSFRAYYHISDTIQFPYHKGSTSNYDYTMTASPGYIWKTDDGIYHGIVNGYSKAITHRNHNHHFTATDLLGTWVDQQSGGLTDVFDSGLPSGYAGYETSLNGFKIDNNLHVMIIAGNPREGVIERAFVVFNDDISYVKYIPIDFSGYTFSLGNSGWMSVCKHNNKYLISAQDGTPATGKRVILESDTLEGVFSYHSTVHDFADAEFSQPGNMFTGNVANGMLYSYNGKLYFFGTGQSNYNDSGNKGNHESYLYKYDSSLNSWAHVVTPCMVAPHGDDGNYTENYVWSKDHMGVLYPYTLDNGDNRIWFGYTGTNGTDSYQGNIGYIDLK